MQISYWLSDVYTQRPEVLIGIGIVVGLLLVMAFIGYYLRSIGFFGAVFMVILGVVRVLAISHVMEKEVGAWGNATLLIFGGVLYLLLFLAISLKARIVARKRLRAEVERRLCYTLPERENMYIRTRLNTRLQNVEEGFNAYMDSTETKKIIKLSYARQLLSGLKSAQLTQAERLQIDEIARAFSVYLHKEDWSVEDFRTLNELCCSILKLAAKYSIQ